MRAKPRPPSCPLPQLLFCCRRPAPTSPHEQEQRPSAWAASRISLALSVPLPLPSNTHIIALPLGQTRCIVSCAELEAHTTSAPFLPVPRPPPARAPGARGGLLHPAREPAAAQAPRPRRVTGALGHTRVDSAWRVCVSGVFDQPMTAVAKRSRAGLPNERGVRDGPRGGGELLARRGGPQRGRGRGAAGPAAGALVAVGPDSRRLQPEDRDHGDRVSGARCAAASWPALSGVAGGFSACGRHACPNKMLRESLTLDRPLSLCRPHPRRDRPPQRPAVGPLHRSGRAGRHVRPVRRPSRTPLREPHRPRAPRGLRRDVWGCGGRRCPGSDLAVGGASGALVQGAAFSVYVGTTESSQPSGLFPAPAVARAGADVPSPRVRAPRARGAAAAFPEAPVPGGGRRARSAGEPAQPASACAPERVNGATRNEPRRRPWPGRPRGPSSRPNERATKDMIYHFSRGRSAGAGEAARGVGARREAVLGRGCGAGARHLVGLRLGRNRRGAGSARTGLMRGSSAIELTPDRLAVRLQSSSSGCVPAVRPQAAEALMCTAKAYLQDEEGDDLLSDGTEEDD